MRGMITMGGMVRGGTFIEREGLLVRLVRGWVARRGAEMEWKYVVDVYQYMFRGAGAC